jgi:hypothetical protein
MIVTTFNTELGLYAWSINEFIRGQMTSARRLFTTIKFSSPIGVFVDLNHDGVAELIACLVDGSIGAFDRISRRRLWTHTHSKGYACIPLDII